MRRLVRKCKTETFTVDEVDPFDKKIYAFTNHEGCVCVAQAREFAEGNFYFLILKDITARDAYFAGMRLTLAQMLRKTQAWTRPPTIYEFDNVVEFLEWALEQEKKRLT